MTSNENQASKWQVDDARPEHIPRILALFKSVFKQEMPVSLWNWKYGNGRGGGVVVQSDDEIIAFFGGADRRVLSRGEAICAVQCGDSMVAEQHRGALTKKGPFYLSVTAYLDKYVGFNRKYLLSYGFANERAMRLAERLGVYCEVGSEVAVSWPPVSGSAIRSAVFDFESPDHQRQLTQLWSKMAFDYKDRLIGIRDLEYLKYRYHDHPVFDYDLHLVYQDTDDATVGLLVTRKENDRLWLLDFVSPASDFAKLARFGQQLASELECAELHGWLTEVDCQLLDNSGVNIGETVVRLPLGVYCEGINPDDVKDAWFLMCGDSDFL